MSYSFKKNVTLSLPDVSKQIGTESITVDGSNGRQITLPAVSANNTGTLTTRTDDNTGVATVQSSHSIQTADVVDVYWSGGVRYGMDATVSGNTITVDGGAGDNLPTQDTAVTVVEQTVVDDMPIDGDECSVVAIIYDNSSDSGAKAHIDFQDSGNNTIREVDMTESQNKDGYDWVNISGGDSNVYTGNPITQAKVSHDSGYAATLYVYAGIDATP